MTAQSEARTRRWPHGGPSDTGAREVLRQSLQREQCGFNMLISRQLHLRRIRLSSGRLDAHAMFIHQMPAVPGGYEETGIADQGQENRHASLRSPLSPPQQKMESRQTEQSYIQETVQSADGFSPVIRGISNSPPRLQFRLRPRRAVHRSKHSRPHRHRTGFEFVDTADRESS
jgi:hypothetical protein